MRGTNQRIERRFHSASSFVPIELVYRLKHYMLLRQCVIVRTSYMFSFEPAHEDVDTIAMRIS